MSSLPNSHAKPGLDYNPIIVGSWTYVALTLLGILFVQLAQKAGKLEKKEVGMSLVFVTTAGVCMWIVYISAWMVSWCSSPFLSLFSFCDPRARLRDVWVLWRGGKAISIQWERYEAVICLPFGVYSVQFPALGVPSISLSCLLSSSHLFSQLCPYLNYTSIPLIFLLFGLSSDTHFVGGFSLRRRFRF